MRMRTNMEDLICENCHDKYSRLSIYGNLKAPFENLCLCDRCADLPLSKIVRKKKKELRRINVKRDIAPKRKAS